MPATMTTGLLPYSKDDKSGPTKHYRHRQPRSFHVTVSIVCALIGVASVAFAVSVLLRPLRIVTVFRCGRSEDTLRTFRSKKVAVSTGSGAGGGEGGEIVARPKLLGFVGIQTGFGSGDRRRALRSTWFPSDPDALVGLEHATGLAFRFVIGKTKDADKMGELKVEEEMYHDFLYVDHEEEYLSLPSKTLAFFKAAFNLFEADFYVKMDDNIYLRPDRLATLLAKERPHPFTYIGCMKKGPVIKDPSLKWYESQGDLLGNEYFSHGYGPIYALSMEVVSALVNAKTGSLRMFTNEDVTIGAWMLAMNVTHEDTTAICHSECRPTSIAVWDIPKCSGLCNPVIKLNELHNNPTCSQSTTIPPEEKDEDTD